MRYALEEMVEVPSVADVHLPMPEEVVFRMHVCEVLDGHICASIGAVYWQVSVETFIDATVDKSHLPFGPQGTHTAELCW